MILFQAMSGLPVISRRNWLRGLTAATTSLLAPNTNLKAEEKIQPEPASLEKDPKPEEHDSLANKFLHAYNPTLSYCLPQTIVEFREAKILVRENFNKHAKNPKSSEEALRYDNADAYSRPWVGLIVQLGAILSRYPAGLLAQSFTDSSQIQSRLETMFATYITSAEVKYLRNPLLRVFRKIVIDELARNPDEYKNDPYKLSIGSVLKKLILEREQVSQKQTPDNLQKTKELDLQRAVLDIAIVVLSWIIGANVSGGAGRAVASVPCTGWVLRDILESAMKQDISEGEFHKLNNRSRAEMISWPALFIVNPAIQEIIKHSLSDKYLLGDDLAKEHLREALANLGLATFYRFVKTPMQVGLEAKSEHDNSSPSWRLVDWYTKP